MMSTKKAVFRGLEYTLRKKGNNDDKVISLAFAPRKGIRAAQASVSGANGAMKENLVEMIMNGAYHIILENMTPDIRFLEHIKTLASTEIIVHWKISF